jgi:hypothetical protein
MPVKMTSGTARPVPRSLSSVLAELELLAPETVDRTLMAQVLSAAGDPEAASPARVDDVIDRLRRAGWLLPLRARGVWEFAPANRSGAFRSGDPFTELRAYLLRHPEDPAAVAMESAAFRRGLAQHPPSREVIAVDSSVRRDGALGSYRHVRLTLGPRATTPRDGVPTHTVEALLVAMACKPGGYRDWPNVGLWLADAGSQIADGAGRALTGEASDNAARGVTGVLELLGNAPVAAWARAAYLLRAAHEPDVARALLEAAPGRPSGPVYLGPRNQAKTYDAATGVYDALLNPS